MRHLQSESHFRHALFALQDPEGYVDSLLDLARTQPGVRRQNIRIAPAPARYDFRLGLARRGVAVH